MRRLQTSLMGLSILGLAGCSTAPIVLPPNVTTMQGAYNASYLDKVDESYQPDKSIEFDKMKLCIAENVINNDVTLRDSAGSFVGSYTGHYYENGKTQNVSGRQTFKYIDDKNNLLIANGTTQTTSYLITDIIKYDLKAGTSPDKVSLIFSNITRAQQNTGAATNTGFQQAGAWYGARTETIIGALHNVAVKLKDCLSN